MIKQTELFIIKLVNGFFIFFVDFYVFLVEGFNLFYSFCCFILLLCFSFIDFIFFHSFVQMTVALPAAAEC